MARLLKRYYIKDIDGRGLHYIQGHIFWKHPTSVEAILDFTPFNTKKEAKKFIAERLGPVGAHMTVGKIQFIVT